MSLEVETFDGMVLDDANDMRQYAEDNKLVAMFYVNPIHNKGASAKAGRPIYDEVTYIRILTPGSKDTFHTEIPLVPKDRFDPECTEMVPDEDNIYIKRFPKQWDAFRKNLDQLVGGGTPLKEVSFLTIGQKAEFAHMNIHSVEQLAGMSDSMAQKFMGFHQIKQMAQAYLERAGKTAVVTQMANELEKRDEKIAEQGEQLKALLAEVQALKDAGKK